MTHTPGPWRIDEKAKNEASLSVRGADNFAVCACRMMAPDGTRYHVATAKANARLIAAAPELLEALDPDTLEAIADEIDCFEHSARASSLRYVAKVQRTAIRKATQCETS